MENPTPFSLNEAIRRWRAEFGSPSLLNATELEELETHLRDHVAQLEASGMKPEVAFAVAAKQLGDRQRVATEFAKVNPQRIWLERAMWMVVGVFVLTVLGRLALVASNVIYGYGLREWNPIATVVATKVFYCCGIGVMAWLLWTLFARNADRDLSITGYWGRKPLWAGIAMVAVLWSTDQLRQNWKSLLERCLPRLDAWLFPTTGWALPDMSVESKIANLSFFAEHILWAAAACLLAASVLRARRRRSVSRASEEGKAAAKRLWLERALWMAIGCMLVDFTQHNVVGLGFLTFSQMLPVPPRNALLLEQAHDLGLVLIQLALWATCISVFWTLVTRQPRVGGWVRWVLRNHPFKAALGLAVMLNAGAALGQLLFWANVRLIRPGRFYGYIGSEWHGWSRALICCLAPAVLFVVLLIWRMKLHEADSQYQRVIDS